MVSDPPGADTPNLSAVPPPTAPRWPSCCPSRQAPSGQPDAGGEPGEPSPRSKAGAAEVMVMQQREDDVSPRRTTGRLCGADVVRCAGCDHTIGPARQRRRLGCLKCPGASSFPDTCRKRVKAPALRCGDHGANTRQARRGTQRRQAEAVALAALERARGRDEVRRMALAPFAADLRAAELATAVGDPDGVRQLRAVARAMRCASDEMYDRCRTIERGSK